ncbi:hypothetical protein THASP1DRAFT_25944, partial [Thamnocephalis sphaerospora]
PHIQSQLKDFLLIRGPITDGLGRKIWWAQDWRRGLPVRQRDEVLMRLDCDKWTTGFSLENRPRFLQLLEEALAHVHRAYDDGNDDKEETFSTHHRSVSRRYLR